MSRCTWANGTISPGCRNGPPATPRCFSSAFILTVVVDLTVAVEIGLVLAAVLFIKRVSETTQITAVDETTETEGSQHSLVGREVPDGVMVYRMFGAFFFGAVDKLESVLKREKREPAVLILRMRKIVAMDATGLNALEDLYERLRRKGKHLVLSGPHMQPLFLMEKAGFLDRIGRDNVCPHIEASLARSRVILGLPPASSTDPLHQEKQKLEDCAPGAGQRDRTHRRSLEVSGRHPGRAQGMNPAKSVLWTNRATFAYHFIMQIPVVGRRRPIPPHTVKRRHERSRPTSICIVAAWIGGCRNTSHSLN